MGLGPIFKHHHRPAGAADADAATAAAVDARCGYTLKVHSHDVAAATAFLLQWSQSVCTGAARVAATVQ